MGAPHHLIFAYGSNMHLADLRRWLHEKGLGDAEHGVLGIEPARLRDWRLVWNYRSPARQGAAANVEPHKGSEVRGVVLRARDDLFAAIDQKEGHPHRYTRGDDMHRVDSLRDGCHLDAWLYVVTPAWRRPEILRPRAGYLDLMVQAARDHGLGADWVASLRAIPTFEPEDA